MSIAYQFGGASQIERIARTVLPVDDPLQASEFFPALADNIRGITDVLTYDLGYLAAFHKLPIELRRTMPAHFERTILLRLCHDSAFVVAWAQMEEDWALVFRLRPMQAIRYVLWPKDWWPVALSVYLCVILSFCGAITYHLAGPMVLPRLFVLAQIIIGLNLLIEFAVIIVYFYGMVGSVLFYLLAMLFEVLDRLGDSQGPQRLDKISRIRGRRLLREADKALRARRTADLARKAQ